VNEFTDTDFKRFQLCNSANFWLKQEFYAFKFSFLEANAKTDGYDKQVIEKKCYSCEGTGIFRCSWKPAEHCWSCLNGIYQTRVYILRRYLFKGVIYHVPTTNQERDLPEGEVKNIITGRVTHEETTEPAIPHFLILLWRHDRDMFVKVLLFIGQTKRTRALHKWRFSYIKYKHQLYGALSYFNYFKRKPPLFDAEDEILPF